MVKYKTQWEIDNGIKFSKKGIIETIDKYLKYESTESEDAKNGRLWEEKLKIPSLTYYLKKGGSVLNSKQPYFRSDITFTKAHKLDKVVKCVSTTLKSILTVF